MKYLSLIPIVFAMSQSATAGTVIYGVNLSPQQQQQTLFDYSSSGPLDPDLPITVPSFDTSLGVLTSVQIFCNMAPTWDIRLENESSTPITPANMVTWFSQTQTLFTYRPNQQNPFNYAYAFAGGAGASSLNAQSSVSILSAYDGVTDFAGTSGTEFSYGGGYTWNMSPTATSSREMAWWSSGTARTIYCSTRSLGNDFNGWPGHWTAQHRAKMNLSSVVLVKYTYQ